MHICVCIYLSYSEALSWKWLINLRKIETQKNNREGLLNCKRIHKGDKLWLHTVITTLHFFYNRMVLVTVTLEKLQNINKWAGIKNEYKAIYDKPSLFIIIYNKSLLYVINIINMQGSFHSLWLLFDV